MKKRLFAILLCAALLWALCPGTAAAGEAGFYKIAAAEGAEIVPLTADGEAVEGVSRDADGSGETTLFYPGSQKLRVTVTDTTPGSLYLLTVSSGDTVLYADQKTGGTPLCFNVSFALPERQTSLLLSIGSNAPGFAKISVPLSYTPAAVSGHSGSSKPAVVPTTPETDKPCPRDGSCPMAAFSDLDRGAWYHDGVHFVLEKGVMNGVGEGSFQPNGTTSRAMLVTMLWRMEGQPVVNYAMRFTDVPSGVWYAEAVRWAAAQHIAEGYSADAFGPEDSVSRQQLVVILRRYAQYKGVNVPSANKTDLSAFLDTDRIAPWAREGMQWALDTGLIAGVGNGKLNPEANAARAQVAAVLARYAKSRQ